MTVLIRRESGDTGRKMPSEDTEAHSGPIITTSCDDRGRDWRDAAANQRIPGIDHHHQMLGKGKEGFYLESQREHGPANTLVSDF